MSSGNQGGTTRKGRCTPDARSDLGYYSAERIDRVVKEAVDRTVILFEAVPAPAGEMPVVLAAGSSGILLHEAIGHGMEADFNRKGVSIYADKLGMHQTTYSRMEKEKKKVPKDKQEIN